MALLAIVAVTVVGCTSEPGHRSSPGPSGSSRTVVTTTPSPAARGPTIESLQMVSASRGWATTQRSIYVTADRGRTWAKRSPTGVDAIAGTFTLDGTRGWVAGLSFGSMGVIHVDRTDDGGRTWTPGHFPSHPQDELGRQVFLSFADASHGWAAVSIAHSTEFVGAILFETTDGGRNWHRLAFHRFMAGPVAMTGPTSGWALGQVRETELLRTTDGGRSWRRTDLPSPRGLDGQQRVVGLPRFLTPRLGVVQRTFSLSTSGHVSSTTVVFSVTRDGGRSWMNTTPVSTHGFVGYAPVPGDVVSGDDWLLASPFGLALTHDGGETWASGVPNVSFEDVQQVDFGSATVGWVLVGQGACTSRGCEPTRVFRTDDGGTRWARNDPGVVG